MFGFLLSAFACTLRSIFGCTYGADMLHTPIHTCTAFKYFPEVYVFSLIPMQALSHACYWMKFVYEASVDCRIDTPIWCETLVYWRLYMMYSGNISHGGNESGCQLFTLQQRVVSLILKWVPTFSLALYVLSWRALLASNQPWSLSSLGNGRIYCIPVHDSLHHIACWCISVLVHKNFSHAWWLVDKYNSSVLVIWWYCFK